ncbi:hypothetical protein AB6806_23790 [Bosea sp. RCC_152_1]|uniref:hypothetical protein n=1 Tax=Bosea sp. RCC_152_1 TaxID=3239228 RepID=UPI0035253BD8
MHSKLMLDGKDISHYIAVSNVMDKHGLKDAKDLDKALRAFLKPEQRVQIVDSKNHDRVLGSIPRPSAKPMGRCFEFTLSPPISFMDVAEGPVSMSLYRIALEIERRFDGWESEIYFSTSAPLDRLVQLRDFRLPGETRHDAEARLYSRR